MNSHARGKRVFYPGLETHPQHELAKRQAKDFGAIVSFEQRGSLEQAGRFAETLRYFAISASVGSCESLVMPPQLLGGSEFNITQRAASLLSQGTVRLSIGLEDAEDLVEDLTQALDRAFA